jgi:hypothetical protein
MAHNWLIKNQFHTNSLKCTFYCRKGKVGTQLHMQNSALLGLGCSKYSQPSSLD